MGLLLVIMEAKNDGCDQPLMFGSSGEGGSDELLLVTPFSDGDQIMGKGEYHGEASKGWRGWEGMGGVRRGEGRVCGSSMGAGGI